MRSAIEIANNIRKSAIWDFELCSELCKAAGMEKEWETACADDYEWNDPDHGQSFEQVLDAAAEKLGVEIY